MTDHYTDGTIVERLVSLGIEEWVLEDTCRETNLIGRWVVISIDGLRSHKPLVLIHWLTSLLIDVLVVSELAACHHVLIEALTWVDLQVGEISPLVRITDLDIELVEFLVSGSLGGIAHPSLCVDALTETDLEILHQSLHNLLGRLWEVTLAVHATERLAHLRLNLVDGTLPERVILLATAHGLAEEVEVALTNLVGEVSSRAGDDIPLHQRLQGSGALGSGNFVKTLHEGWLTDDHILDELALDALGIAHLLQVEVRIAALELLESHLVVVRLWVAKFGSALRDEGEHRLVLEHSLSLLLSLLC